MAQAWDNAGREVCEGLNVQLFVEKLDRMDPIVLNPDELVMPVRMCMMIWGLSYYLKYKEQLDYLLVSSELRPTGGVVENRLMAVGHRQVAARWLMGRNPPKYSRDR